MFILTQFQDSHCHILEYDTSCLVHYRIERQPKVRSCISSAKSITDTITINHQHTADAVEILTEYISSDPILSIDRITTAPKLLKEGDTIKLLGPEAMPWSIRIPWLLFKNDINADGDIYTL